MDLGKNILRRRRMLGCTQEDLALRLGVTAQSVSSWERDETVPELEQLIRIAEVLDVSVGILLGECPDTACLPEAGERIFNENRLYAHLQRAADHLGLEQTRRALPYAREMHAWQLRKGRGHIPYINHPLTMACHALSMGLEDDSIIAACLLHDVCEDCGADPRDLPADAQVQNAVALLSFAVQPGETKDAAKARYYAAISQNPLASIVKLIDRCNNVSSMAAGFTRSRMIEYSIETRRYVLPLLENIRKAHPGYGRAAFLLEYQITALLQAIERLV